MPSAPSPVPPVWHYSLLGVGVLTPPRTPRGRHHPRGGASRRSELFRSKLLGFARTPLRKSRRAASVRSVAKEQCSKGTLPHSSQPSPRFRYGCKVVAHPKESEIMSSLLN